MFKAVSSKPDFPAQERELLKWWKETAAFEQLLSRRPTTQELAACLEFLRKQTELLHTAKPEPAKSEAKVPPSPDPAQRAREGLVRALFSHEDFVTIR